MVAAPTPVDQAVLREALEQRPGQLDPGVAEGLALSKGELKGGRLQMRAEHQQVVRVDETPLRRRLQQVLGVAQQELVEGRVGGDEDAQGGGLPPPGPAQLLPGAGQGARIADQHRCVEAANVDAQLQGVGGDDRADASAPQSRLDGPPLEG